VLIEEEPNDGQNAAAVQQVSPYCAFSGSILISDSGRILTDQEVGCSSDCLAENNNGVQLFQDWYRFETTSTSNVRIEMVYDYYNYEFQQFNDLDIYLFRVEQDGGISYVERGAEPQATAEVMNLSGLAAAEYYIAIQAWDTPTETVNYWVSVR